MRASHIALWLSLLGLAVAPASGQTGRISRSYVEPDIATQVFASDHLALDLGARRKLANELAAVLTYYDPILDAKLIAIALRLDPGCKAAIAANELRKSGKAPEGPAARRPNPEATATYLGSLGEGLGRKSDPDNVTLAGYLIDIANALNPADTRLIAMRTDYLSRHKPVGWGFIKLPDADQRVPAGAPQFIRRISKMRGLLVSEMADGREIGSTQEIMATVQPIPRNVPSLCRFSGPDETMHFGPSMRTALNEAFRTVKLRRPEMATGFALELSFADKFQPKDGPSASTVCALLMNSLFDSAQLSEDIAITGDLTVDGRVRKVGGIPSKIQGAYLDHCRCVGIPADNKDEVADATLLFTPKLLWGIQIFALDSLDDAHALACQDHPEKLASAIARFQAIQQQIGSAEYLTAAHRKLLPDLKAVLQDAPNHLSAARMIDLLEGRAPTTLSFVGSLTEAHRIFQNTGKRALIVENERYTLDRQAIGKGVAEMETLQRITDPRAAELLSACLNFFRTLQSMDPANPTPAAIASYNKSLKLLDDARDQLETNRALMEILMR